MVKLCSPYLPSVPPHLPSAPPSCPISLSASLSYPAFRALFFLPNTPSITALLPQRFDHLLCPPTGPSWLKNLYFAYLVVLRAITKAEDYWQGHHFYTGNSLEDQRVKEKVMEIVQSAKLVANFSQVYFQLQTLLKCLCVWMCVCVCARMCMWSACMCVVYVRN